MIFSAIISESYIKLDWLFYCCWQVDAIESQSSLKRCLLVILVMLIWLTGMRLWVMISMSEHRDMDTRDHLPVHAASIFSSEGGPQVFVLPPAFLIDTLQSTCNNLPPCNSSSLASVPPLLSSLTVPPLSLTLIEKPDVYSFSSGQS
jgi:hypothetical protein